MKQLTIAVPAYNAEAYLETCLASMTGLDSRLEVIVINDGSTDGTAEIAQRYAARYPEQVRLIHKENGGHGSGINTAIAAASGRYFKVVDADDWIVRDNLIPLLDRLEATSADAVVTGYHTVNMRSGRRLAYSSECRYAGAEVTLAQLLEVYEEISSCCSFHGLMYRTELYRNAGIHLSEGIFYEDQEYAALPFAYVDSVLILPFFFYEYLIGNSGQSVAFHNQVKRIGHIETVIRTMLAFRAEIGPLRPDREEYFLRKLAVVVVSYFAVALVKNPDKRQGRADAERFRLWLEQAEPQMMPRIGKKYQTLLLFHRLRMAPAFYQGILDTGFYKKFRRLWMN